MCKFYSEDSTDYCSIIVGREYIENAKKAGQGEFLS